MGARRKARELAVQMLYQYDLSGNVPDMIIDTFEDLQKSKPNTREFATKIFRGTVLREHSIRSGKPPSKLTFIGRDVFDPAPPSAESRIVEHLLKRDALFEHGLRGTRQRPARDRAFIPLGLGPRPRKSLAHICESFRPARPTRRTAG